MDAGPLADVSWGVPSTPLHEALSSGHWLRARSLLAQGQGPTPHTIDLVRQQDLLAGHCLLREAGSQAPLLAGSPWLEAIEAHERHGRADTLEIELAADGMKQNTRRERL